ncbi:hypothetical protein E4K67_16265 [Desulfosporosinus fructosivorans]|uniref:Lipocalin-like domain-containing protein n=1 Tax=Desulfosporosinus fructosivorans TaxID=2018669 RepID=A0A4Z0R4A4_9FIRM|nr:hypothetical protein [Desulfosporosinus fructosivorans]TGE37384.1 hypothetical protein E4K67_16265 [Desulfosporosinus fructosivorans]
MKKLSRMTKFMTMSLIVILTLAVALCGCGSENATTQTQTTDSNSTKDLIIGKWTLSGDTLVFNKNGEATATENGETKKFTYKLTTIDGSSDSIKVTLTDSDKSSSTETAVFKDKDTMVLGDSTFKRANSSSAGNTSNTSNTNTAKSNNGNNSKTFDDSGYYATFQYPASWKITPQDNNTVQLVSATNATYFIRCEKKYLQDSLDKGLDYAGATKDFIYTYIDNLENNANDEITNYTDSSATSSSGAVTREALFNCRTSSGYFKVKMEVTAVSGYLLVTQVWAGEKGFDAAVKEFESIADTIAIK